MPLINRVGCEAVSIRVKITVAAASLAFCEMNKRPLRVAAQSVLFVAGRAFICHNVRAGLIGPKIRSCQHWTPRGTQSPQGDVKVPKNSLQFESRNAWGPALSSVRHTCLHCQRTTCHLHSDR